MSPNEHDLIGPEDPDDLDAEETFAAQLRSRESVGVSRKKVLLRILAAREAERIGLRVSSEQVLLSTEAFRRQFGLQAEGDFERWLEAAGIDRMIFNGFMREVALVDALDRHLDREISQQLPLQRRAHSGLGSRETWVQLNIELSRIDNDAAANAVRTFERLQPLLQPETRPSSVRRFFLMRKPPGLRLRIYGILGELIPGPLARALEELKSSGVIASWAAVPYEPELFRFGGPEVLGLVHDWFETDSLAWLRWEQLQCRHVNKLSREVLSLAVLNDLFLATLKDDAELWDVWCRLAVRHGIPLDADAERVPAVTVTAVKPIAGTSEQEILDDYEEANRIFAACVEETAREGKLVIGSRNLLVTITLFHWNRYAIRQEARQRIIMPMLRALDPK